MNLTILKSIKLSLEIELNENLKSIDPLQKVYQNRLALLIDGLRELISLIEFPEKHKQIQRRCDPDKPKSI